MADGPPNYDARGTYKGPLALLKGEKAQLVVYENGRCLAQFDNHETGYAYGFHDFQADHFDIERIDEAGPHSCDDEGCPHFGTEHSHGQ